MKLFFLILTTIYLVGCSEPKSYLDDAIEKQGFIPHLAPIESFRVGTILRGNHNTPVLVAEAEDCLPDLSVNNVRKLVPITLPNEYRRFQIGFGAELNDALTPGNSVVKFKLGVSYVKSVSIEFGGVTREFLHEGNYRKYLDSLPPYNRCKDYLSRHAIIGQSLRVEKMKFEFYDKFGAQIDITGKLGELVTVEAGVNISIENRYTLVVDSPKHIGYIMAKDVKDEEARAEILYASTIRKDGTWKFESLELGALKALSEDESLSYTAEPLN